MLHLLIVIIIFVKYLLFSKTWFTRASITQELGINQDIILVPAFLPIVLFYYNNFDFGDGIFISMQSTNIITAYKNGIKTGLMPGV